MSYIKRLTGWLALVALMGTTAWGQTIIPIITAGAEATVNGATVVQGPSPSSAGTGNLDPFYRIKDNGSTVEGINTGNSTVQFQTEKGSWTTELLLSTITQVDVGGVMYREFFLDINQTPGNTLYDIWDMQLLMDDQMDLNCFTPPAYPTQGSFGACDTGDPAIPVWWQDEVEDVSIRLNYELESGSGVADMTLLIPDTYFTDLGAGPECDYGQAGCELYVYHYSKFNPNDDGFEEWSTAIQPFVQISKSVTGTKEEVVSWDITKSVTPETWHMFRGDSGTSEYTVAVDKQIADGDMSVSGTITLHVPNTLPDSDEPSKPATVTALMDVFAGTTIPGANISCDAGPLPFTITGGETVLCSYSLDLTEEVTLPATNTATATVTDETIGDRTYVATADLASFQTSTVGYDQINVTDTNGESWTAGDDASWTYEKSFVCDTDDGTHDNTATITETSQSDEASVTVNCYALDVTKTAATFEQDNYVWTISKSVNPDTWNLFTGDSGTSLFTIAATRTEADASGFSVEGTVTVKNLTPIDAELTDVSDLVSPDIAGVVECAPGVTFPFTLVKETGELQCNYRAVLPSDDPRTNTGTATLQNYAYDHTDPPVKGGTTDFSGTTPVDFTTVTASDYDETATATDDNGTPSDDTDDRIFPFTGSGSDTYEVTFTCDADEGTRTNIVTLVGDDSGSELDQDQAVVTVNCFDIAVAKTAVTSFTREWDWTIAKTAFKGETEILADPISGYVPGDVVTDISWEVTVETAATPYADSDWAVEGSITVTNPAPMAAKLTAVSDLITAGDIVGTVDCGAMVDGFYLVPAKVGETEGSLVCSYAADLPDAVQRSNMATGTLQNYAYDHTDPPALGGTRNINSSPEDVVFDLTSPDKKIDQCAYVTDTNPAAWDEYPKLDPADADMGYKVCASNDDPYTGKMVFTYGDEIAITAEDCEGITISNRTDYVAGDLANDPIETGYAEKMIMLEVTCEGGCTLTQGYWKTHNESFKGGASKKADPTWYEVGLLAEGEEFFDSSMSWFEVLNSPPKGNAYYVLAHQFIAAWLNCENVDPERLPDCTIVEDEMADAEALFGTCMPEDVKKGDSACDSHEFNMLAETLDMFNNGMLPGGPMHCDAMEDVAAVAGRSVSEDKKVNAGGDVASSESEEKSVGTEQGAPSESGNGAEEIQAQPIAEVEVPSEYGISNYPNPFNPQTTIQIDVAEPSHVTVTVYDVMGRLVATVVNGSMTAGTHSVVWNAGQMPSGTYFMTMRAGSFLQTRQMMLLK